jgi:hypothetical protein
MNECHTRIPVTSVRCTVIGCDRESRTKRVAGLGLNSASEAKTRGNATREARTVGGRIGESRHIGRTICRHSRESRIRGESWPSRESRPSGGLSDSWSNGRLVDRWSRRRIGRHRRSRNVAPLHTNNNSNLNNRQNYPAQQEENDRRSDSGPRQVLSLPAPGPYLALKSIVFCYLLRSGLFLYSCDFSACQPASNDFRAHLKRLLPMPSAECTSGRAPRLAVECSHRHYTLGAMKSDSRVSWSTLLRNQIYSCVDSGDQHPVDTELARNFGAVL